MNNTYQHTTTKILSPREKILENHTEAESNNIKIPTSKYIHALHRKFPFSKTSSKLATAQGTRLIDYVKI